MPDFSIGTGEDRGAQYLLTNSVAELVSTTAGATNTGDNGGTLYVVVAVTAASGTTPTMTVVVEGSVDGTNYFTLGTVGANGYNVGAVAVTAPSNLTTTATVRAALPCPQYVRTRSVIGGTTPSFTYSVNAIVG